MALQLREKATKPPEKTMRKSRFSAIGNKSAKYQVNSHK
jgi:hypothetical protein